MILYAFLMGLPTVFNPGVVRGTILRWRSNELGHQGGLGVKRRD